MDKYSDLAPWILSAIATATAAAAITFGGSGGTPPRSQRAPSPAVAEMRPSPSVTQNSLPQLPAAVMTDAAPPAAPPVQGESPVRPATPPAGPAGQIWECTTDGQKTFSNNPCGANSALRELGPINTMEATPVTRYARPYPAEPAYDTPDRDEALQDNADEPYQSSVAIPYFVHRRNERTHRPYQHSHGPAPHRN